MAKTISELRNQSIQVRDASAAGENTATRVGTVLNDIVGHIEDYENTQSSNNSSQDAKIEGVKSSLDAEIARAKTEESNLRTQIGTERTERQAAVSREETARIQADNDEKSARQQADNAEQDARIKADNDEKSARQQADNAEQDARIKADNDEKTARENADITLRTMIQTEVSNRQIAVKQEEIRAMAAEKANSQAIADETARATTAEAAETDRAKAEEERLQGEIDNTNTNVGTLENKVNSNHDYLTDEVARLDLTDNEIKADLEAETARAKAAEEANAAAIAEEKAAIMGTDRIADGAVTIEKVADSAIDDEPTAGSDNIVKSGGVADKISELAQEIDSFNEFIDAPYKKCEVDLEGFILSTISEDGKKDEYVTSNYINGLKSKGKDVLTEHQDISGKVDKVENKSLIDKTIADSNSSFENSFYAKVTVDKEWFIINSIDKEGNYYMHSKMPPDEEYNLPDDSLLFRGDDFIQGLLDEDGVKSSSNAITSAEFIPIKNWVDVTNFATLHKGDEVMNYYFYTDDNYTSYISRSGWSGSLNDYNKIEVPSDAAFYKMTIAHSGMAAPIKPSDLDVNKIAYITHLDKIPSYWNTMLKIKEDEILSRDLSLRNGDSFVFITDTHIEVNNMVSPLLVRHLLKTNGERMVVHGGDIINGGKTRELGIKRCRMWLDLFKGIFMPIAIGNHDVNSSWVQASSEYFTETDPYALFVKRMEGLNVNTNAKNYYYVDNPSQKIRYFFLDCHWITDPDNRGISMQYDTQLDWMEAKSKEVGREWSIVVFQHIVFTYPVRDENDAIISANKSELSTRLINKIDSIYDDANMPTVIAVIGGHAHFDWHEYSSKGYPIIVTTTDSSMGDNDYAYSYYGNTDEQAFDVFHIDKNERKIYTTRVGRGNNRVFNY